MEKRFGGVMVSVLVLSAVDHGFEPQLDQTKDYKIGINNLTTKHAVLRTKSWFSRNQYNIVHVEQFSFQNCCKKPLKCCRDLSDKSVLSVSYPCEMFQNMMFVF